MTSFTRKLHTLDPAAAVAIHRQQYGAYRYGHHVTLAQFGTAPITFGKRQQTPVLPAYECWAPELGKPKSVISASSSFEARKEYAAFHQITVTDVAARRRDLPSR